MTAPRPFYLALFAACAALLGYAYYTQFYQGLEPCPLCIFQRIGYIGVAILALIGSIHAPKQTGLRIYSGLITVTALCGGGIAAWQVRMQYLPPDEVPSCGPGLDYMLDVFPLTDALRMAFTGSGECAEVVWTFAGLSMPEWSLVCFTCIALAGNAP